LLKEAMSQDINNPMNDTAQAEHLSSPATESYSIDLLAAWSSIRAGRRSIGIASAAGLVLAAVIAFLTPNSYTSTASFIAPTSAASSLSSILGAQLSMIGVGGGLGSSLRNPADQYVGILQSQSIAADIVSRFHLQSDYRTKKESQTEKALAAHTDFAVGLKDGIVRVSVTDHDPKRAQDIANAYMDELHAANGRFALTDASQRRLFFGEQLAQEKDALENAEADLQKTQEQTGLIAPVPQTAAEIQSIAATRADIESREVELSGLLQGSTDQNPQVIRLRSEIASLEGQLSQMMTGGGNGLSATPAAKVPALQLEYVRKQREVSYHETLFDILSKQYEAARLDESREAPALQIVDQAVLPDIKSGPHRSLIMLAGLVLGALASTIWLLLRDRIASLIALLS
jgi:tyrosine-protein kinase Etk/Wzc